MEPPMHRSSPPRQLAPCPRQLGSLAQPPELPLMATFGCGPTSLHTGTAVPSQAVGLWADGREGSKMLLLGSPSPSRCHPPALLPSPIESLAWPVKRNRQTFKDGLGTLFQKWGSEDLALRASRAWGGGDSAQDPRGRGLSARGRGTAAPGTLDVVAVLLNPDTTRTQPASPALILCAGWHLRHLTDSWPPHLDTQAPGRWTISCAHGSAQGARGERIEPAGPEPR